MAAGILENIVVKLNVVNTGFVKKLGEAQNRMNKFNQRIDSQAQVFSKLNKKQKIFRNNLAMGKIAQQGFFKTMRMGQPELKKFNEQGRKFSTIGGRMANRFRLATHGLRGFRMEMLGVMFFGMMMQRMFIGLLKPVLEAFGVFDLFRLMLLTLFLPIMEDIFPILLKLMQWFMDLSPPVKKAIGIFVLLGAAFGFVLFVIGSFALGIGSLILAFGFLLSPIGLVVGVLTLLAGLVGLGIFASLTENVDKASESLTSFGISSESLDKIVDKIKETWPKIKEFFSNMASKIWEFIKENLPSYLENGGKILEKIIEGLNGKLPEILKVMDEMNNIIGQWVADNSSVLFSIGLDIMGKIFDGMMLAMVNGVASIANAFTKKLGFKAETSFFIEDGKVRSKTGVPEQQDFISRPGQSPVAFSPDDTIVGFKGNAPGFGGGSITVENNFHGFTMDDLNRELDDRDRRLVDEIGRLVKQ